MLNHFSVYYCESLRIVEPLNLEFWKILIVCAFAFLAGMIDSIVGGGGLIQLPALMIVFPKIVDQDIALLYGTNKLSSVFGTMVAVRQYARHMTLDWHFVRPAAASAFIASFFGALTAIWLSGKNLRPAVIVMLIVVAVYTFIRKDFGSLHAPKLTAERRRALGILIGAVIGFYDGFFGPGTGSFLIFAFIGLFGFDFLNSTACAKVVNAATNVGALLCFIPKDRVIYTLGLPMAAFNILGSIVGTRLAILKGSRFVRVLFLVVVSAIIARLIYDSLKTGS